MENSVLILFGVSMVSIMFFMVVGAICIKNEERLRIFLLIYLFLGGWVAACLTAGFGCFIESI